MNEKRRYPRVNVTIFIKFKKHIDDAMNDGISKDISEGGICIKSKTEYSFGDVVSLQLFFGDKLVCLEGKVVWVKLIKKGNYELGIEYMEVGKDDLAVIKKYIE